MVPAWAGYRADMADVVVHDTVAFADGEGGGNPCPVVVGADAWTPDEMRAAAEGFGHETAFVLPPEDPGEPADDTPADAGADIDTYPTAAGWQYVEGQEDQ